MAREASTLRDRGQLPGWLLFAPITFRINSKRVAMSRLGIYCCVVCIPVDCCFVLTFELAFVCVSGWLLCLFSFILISGHNSCYSLLFFDLSHPLYSSWLLLIFRCSNPSCPRLLHPDWLLCGLCGHLWPLSFRAEVLNQPATPSGRLWRSPRWLWQRWRSSWHRQHRHTSRRYSWGCWRSLWGFWPQFEGCPSWSGWWMCCPYIDTGSNYSRIKAVAGDLDVGRPING